MGSRNLKTIIGVVVLMLIVAGLTACSSGPSEEELQETVAAELAFVETSTNFPATLRAQETEQSAQFATQTALAENNESLAETLDAQNALIMTQDAELNPSETPIPTEPPTPVPSNTPVPSATPLPTNTPTTVPTDVPAQITLGEPQRIDLDSLGLAEISPENNWFAVATDGTSIVTLSADDEIVRNEFTDVVDTIGNVVWSPDGGKILITNKNRQVKVIHANTGNTLLEETAENVILSAGWAGDGNAIVVGNRQSMQIWILDQDSRQSRNSPSASVDWSADGAYIASSNADGVELFSMNGYFVGSTELLPLENVVELAWSPDSTHFAGLDSSDTLWIWDVGANDSVGEIALEGNVIEELAWSPDSQFVAVAVGSELQIYNAMTAELVTSLDGETTLTSVDWATDGTMIVLADTSGLTVVPISDIIGGSSN